MALQQKIGNDARPGSSGPFPPELTWAEEHLDRVLSAFGGVHAVYWERGRSSPSLAWRSEQQLLELVQSASPSHATRHRFVTRYELREMHLTRDLQPERGPRLGFVHIRPSDFAADPGLSGHAAVIETYLRPPRHMRHPEYHILRSNAAGPYGDVALKCTPYFSPMTNVAGGVSVASCGVADLFSSISLVASVWGGICQGPLDITVLAANPESWGDLPETRDRWQPGARQPESFTTVTSKGLTSSQMIGILRSPHVRLGAVVEGHARTEMDAACAASLLGEYLSLGSPIIEHVAFHRLYPELAETYPNRHHTIVIVGYRVSDGRIDRIVFHCSMMGPFREISAETLWEAATAVIPGTSPRTGNAGLNFVAVMPSHVSTGLSMMRRCSEHFLTGSGRDLATHFGEETADEVGSGHRRIRLIRMDEIATRYSLREHRQELINLLKKFDRDPASYWWAVECHAGGVLRKEPPASMSAASSPGLLLLYSSDLGRNQSSDPYPLCMVRFGADGRSECLYLIARKQNGYAKRW